MTADLLLPQLLAGIRSRSITHLLDDPTSEEGALAVLEPLAALPDLVVAWSAVNRDRVDAVVTSRAGEWRIVYFVADSNRIGRVHLYEKPPSFAGRPGGGTAVVLNGASGSGKSTLMDAILATVEHPWVIFDEPPIGRVAQSYLIWRETAPALHRGFFCAIAALTAEGTDVALAAAGFPFPFVQELFAGVETIYVGLDCPLDVLLRREHGRAGRWGGIAEDSLHVHEGWSYDLRFDTSTESSGAMAKAVLALMASRS